MSDLKEQMTSILERVNKATEATTGWHDNIRRWRNLYNFKHYEGQPPPTPGEHRFADPTYTNTVDLAVGIFQANRMRWKALAWTPTQKSMKATDKVEKFLAGVLAANNEKNQYNIPYEVNLHFVRDGGAVLYSVWDPRLARSLKQKMERTRDGAPVSQMCYVSPPILTEVVDPLSIYILPGGPRRWLAIMRAVQMSVYDLESTYGIYLPRYRGMDTNAKIQTECRYVDYWEYTYKTAGGRKEELKEVSDNEEGVEIDLDLVVRNAVMFGEDFLKIPQEMDGYEMLPYLVSFFKPTSRTNPAEWSNIMQPLESVVKELETATNRRQHQIDVYSGLPLLIKTGQGRTVQVDPGFGKMKQIGPEDEVMFPAWPGNPPDVQEQIDFLRARTQQSGFADVMYGNGATAMSGYAMSQLGDQSRIRLEQPVAHLEGLWTTWAKHVVSLTTKFSKKTPIHVYGKSNKDVLFADFVSGADLEGYHISCSIRPDFPNEQVRKHAMSTQVKGTLSESTIMEKYLDIDQPEDEQKKRMLEASKNHPVMQMYALIAALKEMADEGDEVAKLAMQSIQQNGVPGMAGRPNEPNNPEQPLGQQGASGMPTQQEMGQPPPGQGLNPAMEGMTEAAPNMSGGVGNEY